MVSNEAYVGIITVRLERVFTTIRREEPGRSPIQDPVTKAYTVVFHTLFYLQQLNSKTVIIIIVYLENVIIIFYGSEISIVLPAFL